MSTKIGSAGVTFPDSTIQATSATTTSLTAGTGISVSGATGAVTISLTSPTFNSVGTYALGENLTGATPGTTYSAATLGIDGGSGTWRCISVVTGRQMSGGCCPTYASIILAVRTV